MSHLTKAESAAALELAVDVGEILGIGLWSIRILEEPCADDCHASVKVIESRYIAEISLSKNWSSLPKEEKNLTIIHEMCHLLHFRIDHAFESTRQFMHDHEYDIVETQYRREMELLVDRLAMVIQGFLRKK